MKEVASKYNTVVVNLLIGLQRNLDKSVNEKIGFAGANTGNLIFTEGMKEQLDYTKEIWINPTALKDVEKPAVVIPSANFIIEGGDSLMTAVIRFLEQTDCPVTMAGLGAQAALDESPEDLVQKLTENQKRAFQMISERATSIGVRGEFSAECLNALGIHNVKIIGCPSFYFRPGMKSHKLKIPSLKRTQVTITPGSRENSLLLERAMEWNSEWMMQMNTELPQLAFEQSKWDETLDELVMNAFPETNLAPQQIWEYMRRSSKIYFEKNKWDQFYDEEDITFAYGSRFHGNMAAFRNGVPALWITHDRRTAELIQTLHLPSIDFEQFESMNTMEEMLDYCDYSDYEKNYEGLHKNYVEFLEENGLRHRL